MIKQSSNRLPMLVRYIIRVHAEELYHEDSRTKYSDALSVYRAYIQGLKVLDCAFEAELYDGLEQIHTYRYSPVMGVRETIMGKLSSIYESTSDLADFLSVNQKATLIDDEIKFMITHITSSISKITGNKQYIFTLRLLDTHEEFPDAEYALSLTGDKARDAIVVAMQEDINETGFYGPVTLELSGRYYRFVDAGLNA